MKSSFDEDRKVLASSLRWFEFTVKKQTFVELHSDLLCRTSKVQASIGEELGVKKW